MDIVEHLTIAGMDRAHAVAISSAMEFKEQPLSKEVAEMRAEMRTEVKGLHSKLNMIFSAIAGMHVVLLGVLLSVVFGGPPAP